MDLLLANRSRMYYRPLPTVGPALTISHNHESKRVAKILNREGRFPVLANDDHDLAPLSINIGQAHVRWWGGGSMSGPACHAPQFHMGLCSVTHASAVACRNSNSAPVQHYVPQSWPDTQKKSLLVIV